MKRVHPKVLVLSNNLETLRDVSLKVSQHEA
jgi:hypothetical protein